MVGEKIGDRDEWMDDQHTDDPPSFCLVADLFVEGGIDDHPRFEGKDQYRNDDNQWQPAARMPCVMSVHIAIVANETRILKGHR